MAPILQRFLDLWVAKQRTHQRDAASRRAFLRTIIVGAAVVPFVDVGSVIQRVTYSPRQHNIDLIKRMGSKDVVEALAAQEAFAAFISAPILQVIEQAPVLSELFAAMPYDLESTPVIPLSFVWGDKEIPSNLPHSEVEAPYNTWCHGWPRKADRA